MEVKGRRIVAEELERLGLADNDLRVLPQMDSRKGEIALRLRQETTLTLEWIARELWAGTPGTLANTLRNGKMRD
jgi:hypothetical protein